MDCPRGLPTFFQYGAGTSGAAPATSGAGPGCRPGTSRVPRPGRPRVPPRHPKLAALPARLMRR
jgi:hypothetical protein